MSSSVAPPIDVCLSALYLKQLVPIGFRWIFIFGFLFGCLEWLLAVPYNLRHLPKVSPYATIWSYARRESVDSRVRRLILPFARRGEGVVLVYMLGKWGVHVLDASVSSTRNTTLHTRY
jgi:hypothetical protein